MNKFMRMAVKEAEKGILNGHGGPFGAVIVKDGKVVAKGHNHVVSHNDPTCHGEVDAIRKACKKLKTFDLTGCDIYTTGQPCPMCKGAIMWANINKIYYGCTLLDNEDIGFRDQIFYDELAGENNGREIELDRKDVLKLFEQYKNLTNKTNY